LGYVVGDRRPGPARQSLASAGHRAARLPGLLALQDFPMGRGLSPHLALSRSREVFYFFIFYFFKIYTLFFLQIWPPVASSIGGKSLPLDEPAVGAL